MTFWNVVVGDVVTRLLGGVVAMKLRVTEVDETHIFCGPKNVGWKFRRENGAEVDEEIGWDGINVTGSYLSKRESAEEAAAWAQEVKECSRRDPVTCIERQHYHGLYNRK